MIQKDCKHIYGQYEGTYLICKHCGIAFPETEIIIRAIKEARSLVLEQVESTMRIFIKTEVNPEFRRRLNFIAEELQGLKK